MFETADEYFDYYRDYHAFWKMYGMALPDDVLKKVYYKNAMQGLQGDADDRLAAVGTLTGSRGSNGSWYRGSGSGS